LLHGETVIHDDKTLCVSNCHGEKREDPVQELKMLIEKDSDHDLIEGLFSSFGIGSYRSRTYMRTDGFASLKRVAEVQPFRHAESRISHLEKTVQMIEARKRNIKTYPPAPDETRFMANERASGASFGAINEKLFDTYGYTLDTRTMQRLIEGTKKQGRGITLSRLLFHLLLLPLRGF